MPRFKFFYSNISYRFNFFENFSISIFLIFYYFFPAHSLLQWKFCVNQKSQIVPLTQQRHCPFFSHVYKLHWSQWCDFDLCEFWIRPVWTVDAVGRISSAVKREKGYAGTRTMTYDTALQHRWLWFIILDASRAFFFFFLWREDT